MKLHNFALKNTALYLAILSSSFAFVSCGTYQSVYNDDDGIYSNRDAKVIVVKTEEKRKEVEENYFSNELDRIKQVDSDEVFTDVDSYRSDADYVDYDYNTIDQNAQVNYSNSPWGYNDNANDVVVHIDLDFNNWSYWDHYYGYSNPWNQRWGYRYGFYGDYAYQPYYYGYGYGAFYYYPAYYYPYYNNYYTSYNNRRNTTYTKRNSPYVNTGRRATTVNSRRTYDAVRNTNTSTTRRVNSTLSNIKFATRRTSTNTKSSNTSRTNTSTTRRNTTTRKNIEPSKYTPVIRNSSSNTNSRRTTTNTNSGRTTSSRSSGTTTTSRRKN